MPLQRGESCSNLSLCNGVRARGQDCRASALQAMSRKQDSSVLIPEFVCCLDSGMKFTSAFTDRGTPIYENLKLN